MKQSHESLRDLYEVTGFELDTLFAVAKEVDGCIGTRMTGAGFGGCNVSLVREDSVEAFKQIVSEQYTMQTGLTPSFYVCDIGDGAKEIDY
jgi:galactokinase